MENKYDLTDMGDGSRQDLGLGISETADTSD